MQHHPGSWYIPWGVPGMGLQKMLAVPFNPATAGFHQPQIAAAAVQPPTVQSVQGAQAVQQATATQQATYHHHHHQHQLHPAAALHNTAAVAAAAAAAMHQHQQHQQHQHQHQPLHPNMAAAAMFTPLTLRSFVTHPHLNLGQQPMAAAAQQPQQAPPQLTAAQTQSQLTAINLNSVGVVPVRQKTAPTNGGGGVGGGGGGGVAGIGVGVGVGGVPSNTLIMPMRKIIMTEKEKTKLASTEKRKADESEPVKDLKKAKLETKALKAKRPGFTDERYHETSYYIENGLRKVYPYYFTFTTFTKGRWVGEKILDVFAREFRAHPAEEYERCIKAGTLTVNYEKVPTDYRLKHNDLLANIVHRHEVPVTSQPITIVHMDDDIVVVNKPASIPVHPCGRYRHNTVVFILAKEYNLKNLRTIHRLDRLTSGLLLFGRSPKKARQMEHQIRNRQVQKEYICRVEGEFPDGVIECKEPIEVVSYKIGVCKVSPKGKECTTTFQKLGFNGSSSVVLCKPLTGRMHQIRVHLQYLGYPVVNDPLYNHEVFGPAKGRGGDIGGKSDDQLVKDLINIHNAENWLGIDGDSDLSMFKPMKNDLDDVKGQLLSDDDSESVSREASPCSESPRPVSLGSESPHENLCSSMLMSGAMSTVSGTGVVVGVGTNSSAGVGTTGASAVSGTNPVILASRIQSQKRKQPKLALGWDGTKSGSSTGGTPSPPTTDSTDSLTQPQDEATVVEPLQECNKFETAPASASAAAATAAVVDATLTEATDDAGVNVTVATQTGHESPDLAFNPDKMTSDKHCYECKVRYRDPKPQDLVMYLHAWKYKGPGWEYETELPEWARVDWRDTDFE